MSSEQTQSPSTVQKEAKSASIILQISKIKKKKIKKPTNNSRLNAAFIFQNTLLRIMSIMLSTLINKVNLSKLFNIKNLYLSK